MPPLATGPYEVDQSVQQATHVGRPRMASGLGGWNERFEQVVLRVAQGLTGPVIPNQRAGLGRPHGGFFPGKPPKTRLLRRLFSPSSAFQNSLLGTGAGRHGTDQHGDVYQEAGRAHNTEAKEFTDQGDRSDLSQAISKGESSDLKTQAEHRTL